MGVVVTSRTFVVSAIPIMCRERDVDTRLKQQKRQKGKRKKNIYRYIIYGGRGVNNLSIYVSGYPRTLRNTKIKRSENKEP